ncbi:MAG: hypothetical protein HYV61_12320 [Candidatus Rokubacteria bacterium]|nr:hypothetical protein [Candidatus Rokubacteria bacterium]
MPRSARRPAPGPAAARSSTPEPRTWQGVSYRPCQAGGEEVRGLFAFAGAWAPPPTPLELGWEAVRGGRLVGGVLVERQGEQGMLHGPVVVESEEPFGIAEQLIGALLDHAELTTLYARPQALERLWVRFGFVPLPEAGLPAAFKGRPGSGLFVWRRPGSYRLAPPAPEGEGRGGRGPR